MMIRKMLFLVLLCLAVGLMAEAQVGEKFITRRTAGSKPRVADNHRSTLDDTLSTQVTIKVESGTVKLYWKKLTGNWDWIVIRADSFSMAHVDTVAVTSDTLWTESPSFVSSHLQAFYRIIPRMQQGTPNNYIVIEDFDSPVTLTSYSSAQDHEPNNWRRTTDGAYNPAGECLELYGNTWKKETLDTMRHIAQGSVWRIAVKCVTRGENIAFGIADSANEMWYEFWGTETWQSEAWIPTYNGWFAQDEWILIDLPVGDDWFGRFGYYGNISKLFFANDNDGGQSNGVVRFDEIRDVTGALNLPPVADFRWNISSRPTPDSMQVAFTSMSYDPDGPLLSQFWTFGDGRNSFEANPIHRYAAGGSYIATLTVRDTSNHSTWTTQQVRDTAFTSSQQLSALFVGDVMMARRYEGPGGIIETQGVNAIFASAQPLISSVDLATCNLECPLTNATENHPTKDYTFKGRPEYVAGLTFAGFDFCAMGNNHNFDYLVEGMHDTKHVLDSVGLLSTGAGDDDEIARQPVFYTKNGLCVAILSFCNRDGSYDNLQPFLDAGRSKPGFAMWNRTAIEQTIPQAQAIADVVIVQVHSGIEYSEIAPKQGSGPLEPEERELSLLPDTSDIALRHYAITMGANLVINHHPHVMQGCEVYQGKLIAHSMGNFAFDQDYPETFHTMAISAHLAPGNATNYIVHPVYIDRYIPHQAIGEFGAAILDYQSELSRGYHTWVTRQQDADTASIILDTLTAVRSGLDHRDTLLLENRDGSAYSAPHKLLGGGYPVQASMIAPASAEFRVGHEILWFGNMENEGATAWDLNSNYERYDTLVSNTGQRSIRLNRGGGGNNSVSTMLRFRPLIDMEPEYSMVGWMRGDNSEDAQMVLEMWSGRAGGTARSSTAIGGVYQGTFAWQKVWENLTVPSNTYFYNVTLNLHAPSSGEGLAWFDDLAVIRWDDWMAGTTTLPFPSDLTYIQVRAQTGTQQAVITYRKEWVEQ